MKYISLLNPITIKYLIDNPNTKYFIINTLKLILNDEDFELLNYFTHEEEMGPWDLVPRGVVLRGKDTRIL